MTQKFQKVFRIKNKTSYQFQNFDFLVGYLGAGGHEIKNGACSPQKLLNRICRNLEKKIATTRGQTNMKSEFEILKGGRNGGQFCKKGRF